MFPEVKPRVTSRFEGNKINCFPRDQSLSDLLYNWRPSWNPASTCSGCENLLTDKLNYFPSTHPSPSTHSSSQKQRKEKKRKKTKISYNNGFRIVGD